MLRRSSTVSRIEEENQARIDVEVQKIISILSTDDRTLLQLTYVARRLEKSIAYFKKLKAQLREDIMLKLIKSLLIERFSQFETVFNQGETGRKMYFVLEGEVGILVKTQESVVVTKKYKLKTFEDVLAVRFPNFRQVAVKKQFDYFGEIAIEQRIPRTATVIAKIPTVCGILTYEAYQKLLRDITEEAVSIRSEVIASIYPFNQLNETSLQQLLHGYEEINLNGGALLFKRMQKADCIYLIIEGEVLVQKWEQIKLEESDEEETEESNFVNKTSKKLINIGVFGRGQMIGDYEYFMKLKFQTPMIRCTQGVVQNEVKIFRIWQSQFNEIISHTLNMNWYANYLFDKYECKQYQPIPKLQVENRMNRTQSQITILNGFQHHTFTKISSDRFKVTKQVETKLPSVPKQSPRRKLVLTIDYKDKANLKYFHQVSPSNQKEKALLNTNNNFSVKQMVATMKQRVLQQKTEEPSLTLVSSARIGSEPSTCHNIQTCNSILLSPRHQRFIKKEVSFQKYKL